MPLDWLNPSDPRLATIAIIRFNTTDRANYNGPVFINPGGPGGSGVWFVKRLGPYYQYVVGTNHVSSLSLPIQQYINNHRISSALIHEVLELLILR